MKTSHLNDSNLAQKLASILSSRNLTLYQVSRRTEQIYGHSSPYFIPHNYYSELKRERFSPSIYQLAALARITRYSLGHWLRLFAIDIGEIARLQIRLPTGRTQLLNSSLVDNDLIIPWLEERDPNLTWPGVAPLARLLRVSRQIRIGDDPRLLSQDFVYAKVGSDDALAFPLVMPRSLVRANPNYSPHLDALPLGKTSKRLFLIEHSGGIVCCQLRRVGDQTFSLVSTKLPFAEVDLVYPAHARVLGVVDLEIRPVRSLIDPEVAFDLSRSWKPRPLLRPSTIAYLIRSGRSRMHLSLAATAELSKDIARCFRDERYSISPSSLSDYEAAGNPPRHLQKIVTLCAVYGLQFKEILELIGIPLLAQGTAIADSLHQSTTAGGVAFQITREVVKQEPGKAAHPARLLLEVPVFLRRSISDVSGISRPALEDFYWIGGEPNPLHPALEGGVLAIVDRQRKKPLHFRTKLPCQQPIFLLLTRNGRFFCASCSKEGRSLMIHPYPQHLHRAFQLRSGDEAEIVGQLVTIVRRLA